MTPTNETLMEWLNQRFNNHEEHVGDSIKSLGDKVEKINTVLTAHVAAEEADRQLVIDMKRAVWGNGKPGHDIRIDRLEQWKHLLQWILSAIAVPLVLYGFYAAFQAWLR
jgi:hypothetical protein